MRTLIYLDESGDLGWNFDAPFQKGGSSRYLTLSAVVLPEEKLKYLERVVRSLYTKRKRPLKNELKSIHLNMADNRLFLQGASKILSDHPDICLRSITVNKAKADRHFIQDPNVLYNYMVKLLLLDSICKNEYVDFIPDRRSERVNTKWNMGEYLNQMVHEARFERPIANRSCSTTPQDSAKNLGLQFIDFYAGMVWAMYECNDEKMRQFMCKNRTTNHKLFF